MRKIFLVAMLSATAALLSTQAIADPVKRVVPHGQDGDKYYYEVRCTNGSVGSVVVVDKDNSVCAQALGREQVCNSAWNVQKAAEQACR
jgi:hypothetical protein